MGIQSNRRRQLEKHIRKTEYVRLGVKTTVCCLTLHNGFEVIGTSACVHPEDFNRELGEVYALENAYEKMDELIGFLEQDMLHQEKVRNYLDIKEAVQALTLRNKQEAGQ